MKCNPLRGKSVLYKTMNTVPTNVKEDLATDRDCDTRCSGNEKSGIVNDVLSIGRYLCNIDTL